MLMVLLLGIAYLAHAYQVGATDSGDPRNTRAFLSQLIGAVAGRGIFYWVSIASILLVLCLSANTSFADFPRLCRAVAEDGFSGLARSATRGGGWFIRRASGSRDPVGVLLILFAASPTA